MGLAVGWNSSAICHHCHATSSSYSAPLCNMRGRRSAQNSASEACRPQDCTMATFHPIFSLVRLWSSRYTLNCFGACYKLAASSLQGPFLGMRNFDHNQIRWCAMHTLNLGMVTFIVGSALRVLTREHHWAGGTEERQMKEGFKAFNEWAKLMKIPYLGKINTYYDGEWFKLSISAVRA